MSGLELCAAWLAINVLGVGLLCLRARLRRGPWSLRPTPYLVPKDWPPQVGKITLVELCSGESVPRPPYPPPSGHKFPMPPPDKPRYWQASAGPRKPPARRLGPMFGPHASVARQQAEILLGFSTSMRSFGYGGSTGRLVILATKYSRSRTCSTNDVLNRILSRVASGEPLPSIEESYK